MKVVFPFKAISKTPLARKMGLLFADRSVQLLSQLFNIFIVAGYLGAADFGILLYGISLYGLLLSISNLGVERVLVIELSQKDAASRCAQLIVSGLIIKITTALLFVGVLYGGRTFFLQAMSSEVLDVLLVLSISLFFSTWVVADGFNQSNGAFAHTAYPRIISTAVMLLVRLALVAWKMPFEWFVISFVLEQAICFLLMAWYSRDMFQSVGHFSFAGFRTVFEKVIRAGALVMISTVCIVLYFRASQGIIEQKFDKAFLGVYSLSVYLVEVPVSLASIMATIFTPKLTLLLSGVDDIKHSFASAILKLFLVVGVLSVIIILVTGSVLSMILGDGYDGLMKVIIKTVIALPVIFVAYFINIYLLCSRQFGKYLLVTALGAVAALSFLWLAYNYVTITTAPFMYLVSQVIASVAVPLLFLAEIRKLVWTSLQNLRFKSLIADLRPLFFERRFQ